MAMEAAEKAIPKHILDCPFDPADTYNFNARHRSSSAVFNPESRLSQFHRSK
jgi:hypothetical protein